ncbi:hypothetical protein YQE_05081, partial [Dendroctonus ponderosae]
MRVITVKSPPARYGKRVLRKFTFKASGFFTVIVHLAEIASQCGRCAKPVRDFQLKNGRFEPAAFATMVGLLTKQGWGKLEANHCKGGGQLKYLWGDALTDDPGCVGPSNHPYPIQAVERSLKGGRTGRAHNPTIDPYQTRSALMAAFEGNHAESHLLPSSRRGRAASVGSCGGLPPRLCKTRYNTTAPMYGVSLTSGQPVTIVQKFPDLLQQVVFEVCESSECELVRGECTQTYVPYLFLVIPLGPVTLTGQDYVLVESGCVCRPKYPAGLSKP